MGRADGISDAELDALSAYARSPLFTERDRAALEYAEAVCAHSTVSDQLFERVRRLFSEDEIVELTAT
ncbi:MAG: carboxymuconolactone decarboxylase family protein, partial [Acidobacteria bacterium]|nr:carboxymuconolactone decarboxylase family protein [Acidobacteriota bacterium]